MSKRIFEDPSELIEKYNSGISTMKLAEEYNTSHTVIGGTLKRVGVKIRSLKEAHEFRDISGDKNPNYGGGCFGENNGNWQGGKLAKFYKGGNQIGINNKKDRAFRKYIKTLDDYKCCMCDSKDKIEIHHITPWVENETLRYDEKNCLALCKSCHTKSDNKHHKEEEKIKLLEYIEKNR
jgi:hypothetical protein